MYGVVIEKGLSDWQIIQQNNRIGKINLSGVVIAEDDVLKQNAKVVVRVLDEINNTRILPPVFCKIKNKKWNAEFEIPTGGPYKIETFLLFGGFKEKRGDRRFHIGVGDNYVIAGQSNAVGVGKDMISEEEDPNIHIFRLNGSWAMAAHPLHDTTDTNYPDFAEQVAVGYSPWLSFAKTLSRNLGYPVGLIPAAKGGIPLSFWDRKDDGRFFNHMLNIIKDSQSKVRGIVWYQGCNDTYDSRLRTTYFERFKSVCEDFRKELGNLPIITVQLNKSTCTKGKDLNAERKNFSILREVQRKAAKEIKNLYLVSSIDLPVCDGIHNSCMSSLVLGQRAANIALKYIYGRSVICDYPDISKAFKSDKNEITLYFDNVFTCIFSDNNPTEFLPFSAKDEKGRILPEDYECVDNRIVLRFKRNLGRKITVSCDGPCESGLVPYDLYSYLPIIMFDEVEVK